jgi:hypothetical protein
MKKDLYLLFCIAFITGCSYVSHAQIISTFAGNGVNAYSGNGGPATAASFSAPTCVAIDKRGNIYISDPIDSCVRKVSNNYENTITTYAGYGSDDNDNIPATNARLHENWSITVDKIGNLYIADQIKCRIRRVDTSGIIATIAGNMISGFSGDGGPATLAQFTQAFGVAADGAGNVYVSDQSKADVRKINTSGIITAIAGTGTNGYGGDGGPATSALISVPWGIAADTLGNVYIGDAANNRIRKVDNAGIITTIAGTGAAAYGGDNGPATLARLNYPIGVFPDRFGNIYIADCYNNRIRKIDPSGIITTVAGTGSAGFSGDGGLATAAALNGPSSVVVDDSGNIYIADFNNVRIRKIKKNNLLFFTGGHVQHIDVCENSLAMPINAILTIIDYYTGLTDTWRVIAYPLHGSLFAGYSAVSAGAAITPSGLYYTPTGGYTGTDSFRVAVSDGTVSDTTMVYVTVKTLLPPAGAITGPSLVCPGSVISLSDTLLGGAWSAINGAASVVQPGSSNALVTGQYAGTDTIFYSVYNSCGTGVATKVVIIKPLPDTGIITGPSTLCAGDTIVLLDAVAGGQWTTTDAYATVIPVMNGIKITGVLTGEDMVSYTVSDSFCTAAATGIINIYPLPYVGPIEGPGSLCANSSIALSDSVQGGIWSATNGNATVSPGASSSGGIVTGITPGGDIILYTINFICGIATATKSITIDSLPEAPSIVQNGYFLSVASGYSSYQWMLAGALIPGATQDTLIETTAGVYAVTVGNALGCTISSSAVNSADCSHDEIKIYPNPCQSTVNIQWCKKVIVKIIAGDGKIFEISESVNTIDLGDLPDGVYLLVMFDQQGNKLKTKSITKQSQR